MAVTGPGPDDSLEAVFRIEFARIIAGVARIVLDVGIAEEISLGPLGSLFLLVEKDFACLDRSDEDNQDTFANPHAGATC